MFESTLLKTSKKTKTSEQNSVPNCATYQEIPQVLTLTTLSSSKEAKHASFQDIPNPTTDLDTPMFVLKNKKISTGFYKTPKNIT